MNDRSGVANFILGFISVFVGHFLGGVLLYVLAEIFSTVAPVLYRSQALGTLVFFLIFGIGIAQLIYVLPLCIWLRRRRLFSTMKGVITAAIITLLLNGSCFLMFATSGY